MSKPARLLAVGLSGRLPVPAPLSGKDNNKITNLKRSDRHWQQSAPPRALKIDFHETWSAPPHAQILKSREWAPVWLLLPLLAPRSSNGRTRKRSERNKELTTNFERTRVFEVSSDSSSKNSIFPTPKTINTFVMTKNNHRRSSLVTASSVARRRIQQDMTQTAERVPNNRVSVISGRLTEGGKGNCFESFKKWAVLKQNPLRIGRNIN